MAESAGNEEELFPENFAIAETVCDYLSLPASGPGIHEAPGRPIAWKIEYGEGNVYLIDAFSANDVESTRAIEQAFLKDDSCPRPFVALLNNRSDRPLRMRSFTSYLSGGNAYDFILLAGDHAWLAKRGLRKAARMGGVCAVDAQSAEDMLEEIARRTHVPSFTVVGMGNYRGIGERMRRLFGTRGRPCY